MINFQLREYIIKPTLIELDMYSQAAEDLIAGTIAQESLMGRYIKQVGGPALGICQMEPVTHNDIHDNYLSYRPEMMESLEGIGKFCDASEMVWNLRYSVAMCRIHYYRQPGAIPTDIHGQAAYWKKFYNTHLGKGSESDYALNYGRYAMRKD